jgi:hypothetical protein
MFRILVGVLTLGMACAVSTCKASADQCDAVAGELAARVPGVNIGRRSSAAIFAFHPGVKYSSIGCPNGKSVNFFAEVETKFPSATFFDFFGAAASITLGGVASDFREGTVRCLKAGEDVSVNYSGLSFQCSADNLSSSVVVQKQ